MDELKGIMQAVLDLSVSADPNVHGMNDGNPLHQVVWKHAAWPDHLDAVRLLLAHGADPHRKTRIDDCTSALEDAEVAGMTEIAALLRSAA